MKMPESKKKLKESMVQAPVLQSHVGNEQIILVISFQFFLKHCSFSVLGWFWEICLDTYMSPYVACFFFLFYFRELSSVSQKTDSVPVKEKYHNWAYRSGGYKKARDVFKGTYRHVQLLLVSPPPQPPCTYIICEE